MQEKTNTVADNSARLALKVHRGKSKVMKNKAAANTTPTTLEGVGGGDGVGGWIRRRCKSHLPR